MAIQSTVMFPSITRS